MPKLIGQEKEIQSLLSPVKEDVAGSFAPVKKAARSLYAGAKVTRLDSDLGDTGEINRNIYENLRIMRARSRQLAIDNVHVGRFLQQSVQEILGENGLKLSVEGPKEEVNETIEMLYEQWGSTGEDGISGGATTSGQLTLLELEELAIRTMRVDGEFFCRIIPGYENDFGFSVFPFEADRLELGFDAGPWADGSFIQNSIEYNKYLKPIAYHVLERHPGDNVARWPDGRFRMRIPANEIIHLFKTIRAGQGRGIPATHAIIISATHLKAYVKATIVSARVVASKFGVIYKEGADPYDQDLGEVNETTGEIINKVEAGRIFRLRDGEKFDMFDPKHPSGEYPHFTKSIKQDLAVGTNIPYSTISGDLSGTSFASGRLDALNNQEFWGLERTYFKEKFKKRVYRAWLLWAYLTREELYSIIMPGELRQYGKVKVHNKPVIWIDPEAMSKVVKTNLETRMTTLHKELAKQGIDYKQHMEELKQESKDALELAKTKQQIMAISGGKQNEQENSLRLIENKQKGN